MGHSSESFARQRAELLVGSADEQLSQEPELVRREGQLLETLAELAALAGVAQGSGVAEQLLDVRGGLLAKGPDQLGLGSEGTHHVGLADAGLTGDALEAAKASVERYNQMCADGVDADFGKKADLLIPIDEAPFYIATQGTQNLYGPGLNTLAGLCVNGNYQVLTASKNAVIPGLFAVGIAWASGTATRTTALPPGTTWATR